VENTGRVDTGQLPSAILPSGKVPYAIYFPPCYDTRVRYPVAYLLHGIPFDEAQWLSLGWQAAADQAISSHRVPPFIAVFPRGDAGQAYNNSSGGDGSWEQVMVKELIPYIDTVYNTLASKHSRAIGGISRGAVWALEIAFRNPDLFEAVGGHSSAMAVNKASPEFDPLQIAQSDNVDQLFGLHILLDSGDTDWTLQETAQLHAILDERGITNTLLVGRGGHVAKYWASQMDNYVAFYGSSFTGLLADGTTPK
jgi:enterochelin esterase-like enzyme